MTVKKALPNRYLTWMVSEANHDLDGFKRKGYPYREAFAE
jgi:hypothetical protein